MEGMLHRSNRDAALIHAGSKAELIHWYSGGLAQHRSEGNHGDGA